ncbi:MAG: FecR domain-containing protein [Rhodocyclaceae bacterium]|nr:FecR domain-containing protein [Rhodocyclaceae bacterium]MBP7082014.1 FecR domain-containing protein [Rhodocyclaceae bacterium]
MPTKNSPFKLSMLMVLAWLAAVPAVNAAQAGNITKLKGDVYIGRPDVPVITAKGDDPINEGDLITTAKGGEVLIRFKDNSIITLRPDSSLLVTRFQHEEKASDSFLTSLLKGGLRAVTGLLGKTRPESVSFTTPTATVGIRGTDFEIAILPEDTADARAGTYNYVHDGSTSLGLEKAETGPTSIVVKQEETGLALANPKPGEPALQILKQRPAFLRGGGFDAHMMQLMNQPIRAIQIMPRR